MNGQSFVVQCDATDAEMRQFLKKYKIGTERRCHVIDDQSNIAMVEAGLGISIMPRMLLRSCTAAVKIYPIEPEEYRWWVWLSSAPRRWLRRSSRCSTTSWTSAARWTRSFSENTKMTGPHRCGPVFTSPIAELMIESAGKIRYTIANHLYDRNVRGL